MMKKTEPVTNIILSPKLLREFGDLDPNLEAIFWQLVNLWISDSMTLTSIFRTPEHDRRIKGKKRSNYIRGVHTVGPPYRAMDISVYSLGPQWPTEIERIAEVINDMWAYDPMRPNKVVCYVKPHGTGPHIHLQVHLNTVRKAA
jgi:hypothetical protein